MSYCVNCGVKLADTEKDCPLCGTPVINPSAPVIPDAIPTYPVTKTVTELWHVRIKAIADIVLIMLMIPIFTCLISDYFTNGQFNWSPFVALSLVLFAVIMYPPYAIKKHAFYICFAIDVVAVLGYLYLMNFLLKGDWFVPFALPVTVILAGLVLIGALLIRRSFWHILKTLGTLIILTGMFIMALEWLLNICFFNRATISWAWYSFIPCVVIGIILFFIANNPRIKEAMRRKFFI